MRNVIKADVFADGRHVGTIAGYDRFCTAFEYTAEWIETGFSISPISLPLRPGLFVAEKDPFSGLYGIFDDSLPDGWGRLLTDRYLKEKGVNPDEVSVLTRLCMLSGNSSGILEYKPQLMQEKASGNIDFDELCRAAENILLDLEEDPAMLDTLFREGGSSGGARPKVYATIDGQEWIVKFPAKADGMDAGKREYMMNMFAKECGIDIPEAKLIPSAICPGFFASKRFDRKDGRRIHMISLSGLLESSHRFPVLDYSHLMKATTVLTKSGSELWKAFRLAVFNVTAGNMDDHGKNFAFLFDEDERMWELAPAYDLTKVSTYYGEQSTTVNGKGKNIDEDDFLALASQFRLSRQEAIREIRRIRDVVRSSKEYLL